MGRCDTIVDCVVCDRFANNGGWVRDRLAFDVEGRALFVSVSDRWRGRAMVDFALTTCMTGL